MTDKKFTDEEIIEALECHINADDCESCGICGWCEEIILTKLVLDLINRQKAEIERLQKEANLVSILFQDLQERINDIKAEAYKEFAKRMSECCVSNNDLSADAYLSVTTDINCILKEMVGEEK